MSSDDIEEAGSQIEAADAKTGWRAKAVAGVYLAAIFALTVAGIALAAVTGVFDPTFAPTASPDLTGPIEWGARWFVRLFVASIAAALLILAPGSYIAAVSTLVADWAEGRARRNDDEDQ